MDHVVRHVVVEYNIVVEGVGTLFLPVEETVVMAQELSQDHVQIGAVLVSFYNL